MVNEIGRRARRNGNSFEERKLARCDAIDAYEGEKALVHCAANYRVIPTCLC
jgi:hypothetical protein